jgi:uncharacterized protein YebE (UPF0316 family)
MYIAYGLGFATGTFVGILIEEKLAIGIQVVRIILPANEFDCGIMKRLSHSGYGVTEVDARGATGYVKIIYTIVRRKDIPNVISIINECNSKAFYSIEDAKTAKDGIFPSARSDRRNVK